MAVHYQPGSTVGGPAGEKTVLMLTTRTLMAEVSKNPHFVVTDGKNDTNAFDYVLSCFSLRTVGGTAFPAFFWIGETESESTIYKAGEVFSNLVPCQNTDCLHPWVQQLRPDGGFTVTCPCSIQSNFSPACSTDKFWGSINALTRLGWRPVTLCDFHAFQAIDRHLRESVSKILHKR